MSADGVHPVAAGGFSASASVYSRIRPTYARAAIGRIAELVRATPDASNARVLDVLTEDRQVLARLLTGDEAIAAKLAAQEAAREVVRIAGRSR